MELFQKKDLNFAISKFSKFFKKYLFYNIGAPLEVSLGKKLKKKNKNGNKEIEAKNREKLRIFSEGRRQDFSSDYIAFQKVSSNWLKIAMQVAYG